MSERADIVKRILENAGEMTPPLQDIVGKFAHCLEVIYALEHKQEYEERLAHLKERFRQLVEDNPIGMSITSLQGAIIEANPAAFKMFGCDSLEEYTLLPTFAYWHDWHDRADFLELVGQGAVRNFEARLKRKDGSLFWGAITSVLFPVDGTTRLANFLIDISDQKAGARPGVSGQDECYP